jgi:hypothetical protein
MYLVVTFVPLLVQLRGRKALDNVLSIHLELLNNRTQWEEGECFLRGHVCGDWTQVVLTMQEYL